MNIPYFNLPILFCVIDSRHHNLRNIKLTKNYSRDLGLSSHYHVKRHFLNFYLCSYISFCNGMDIKFSSINCRFFAFLDMVRFMISDVKLCIHTSYSPRNVECCRSWRFELCRYWPSSLVWHIHKGLIGPSHCVVSRKAKKQIETMKIKS